MKTECPFCRIAKVSVLAHEVYRNDRIVAFLDRGPIRTGHIQIIPIEHYAYFEMMPQEIAKEVMALAQRIARCQKALFSVERVAFFFTGGDIPHAHCHLVPMIEKTDITSRRYILESQLTFRELPEANDSEQRQIAAELSEKIASCGD